MRNYDRVVQEVTSGFERGVVSIGAAAAGMRTLADATGSFQTKFRYLLVAADGISWQIGVGEYFPGSPDFVDLSAVGWSSNSGSRISLPTPQSGPHGWLYCTPAAADSVVTDSNDPPMGDDAAFGFLAAGGGALAGANYTVALGLFAQALATNGIALGAWTKAGVPGALMIGDGADGAQRGHLLDWCGRASSSGTAPATIGNGQSADALTPRESAAYELDVRVIGRRTSPSTAVWGASARVVLLYPTGGSPVIVGTPSFTVDGASAGLSCSAALSIVSGTLQIAVTGSAAGETWRWSARLSGVEQWGD